LNVVDGILLIDKPSGPTSHDVVVRLRNCFGQKRIGHAGTLDPIASGLLVCLFGRATRLTQFIVGHRKTYLVKTRLGQMRDTYDRTGEIIAESDRSVTREELASAIESFPNRYEQLPPKFSAKKVQGRPAYRLARQGRTPELKPQKVEIFRLSIVEFNFPDVELLAEVSAGTYIRSLAVDLAEAVNSYGYVDELRRTQSGPFTVEEAMALEELADLPRSKAESRILSPETALTEFDPVELTSGQKRSFVNGQFVDCRADEGLVRVYCRQEFVGMGRIENNILRPVTVIRR